MIEVIPRTYDHVGAHSDSQKLSKISIIPMKHSVEICDSQVSESSTSHQFVSGLSRHVAYRNVVRRILYIG